ncbi:hypothetical protein A2454_02675 [Candidatus Peribacteria bacterium RIFOXYC2_FULL_55_14]|nr:MAG: hypothetical protein UY85_C0021G0008 [Candidatus Peribacteria bacterium GW2011_GWB1_54_5]KKW40671.1 MAG: hypothetical protein UY87_C0015G0008 [Candidatus Peribacteria bacterium GW2011_GWC2_54_8]KKW41800.1 MAG: hypothetical protein UY90_C0046G0004 [Candidatus Peregrinibacteria bacterium GW2011_GWA2_54_9]OGJ73714.1 MAG: hypothetical protein A2384_04000 [Candidatus Peribacteria bacterium RIFOXYB1_FULL_54_35]OGJ74842.1 MAG: hypothetical protein A2217_02470 [Candidatus Peribacteria bacterium
MKKTRTTIQTSPHTHWCTRLGKNLLLSILSICLFLAGMELVARIWYSPQKLSDASIFEYDSEKLFRLKSNLTTTFKEVPFTTNAFGYRDNAVPMAKPKDAKRVLLVGDSIAFGFRVLDSETFDTYLEQSLNNLFDERGENTTVEVINTAAPGNSPFQEYHDLKRGLAFEPDVVLLQLTLNDIIEERGFWIFEEMGIAGKQGSNSAMENADYIFGTANFPHIDTVLRQRSALYCMLKDWGSRIRFRDPGGERIAEKAQNEEIFSVLSLVYTPNHPTVLASWQRALGWIQKITETAERENVPLIILLTPYNFQFPLSKETAVPQQTLSVFAQNREIPFVDLLAILQEQFASNLIGENPDGRNTDEIIAESIGKQPERWRDFWNTFFLDYDHPSPAGNRFIADILLPIVAHTLE